MPRHARVIPLIGYMHIISRGNNRRKLFRHERDKKRYYLYLMHSKFEDKIDILHYCIMSNHLHLLVGVNQTSDLSRFMKRVNLKYTCYYQSKYTYCGHLWQNRFKGKIIDNEIYLIRCGKYIELNPVRAGIVFSPQHYKFSSYHYYAFGENDALITPNPLYEDLSLEQKKRWYLYRNLMMDEEEIRDKILVCS